MSNRGSKEKQRMRRAVARRDGWKCHYCKKPLPKAAATLDHVVPLALGGSWRIENLRLACRHCNRMKADKPPHVFHNLLAAGLIA
jgi:5-methylcytosine-specific restriction endonuclease McrA